MVAAPIDVSKMKAAAVQYAGAPKRMLINGLWRDATSDMYIEARDPATEQVISAIPAGDAVDVDLAVRAAREAFDIGVWPKLPAKERARLLWKLSDLLEREMTSLSALETLDFGAPLTLTGYMVQAAIDVLRFYAGMATKLFGMTSEISGALGQFHAYTRAEPVGVVGAITPWNAPLTVVCNKLAPAIAAGCTCVIKPAEWTSLTAIRLGELLMEAGFPPGVINIVTGEGPVAGAALAAHPGIDKISFTGSTAVGRELVHVSAATLRRLTLELGGKSPVIVAEDADLDVAIPGAAMAILANSGQVCFAGSRLYIHKKIYERVVSGVAEFSERMRLGSGFEADSTLGPLVSDKQRTRVQNYIQLGQQQGAELVTGGGTGMTPGYFVAPTVFANVGRDARIAREEIFGPVLVATPYDDEAAVVKEANDTNYGLGAGIFTTNLGRAHSIAKVLRAGNVWINCYGVIDASMPFGGFKQSGWGREFGIEGVQAFLETKSVFAGL